MAELAAVWIVIAHFTVLTYGGDVLPEGKRMAFTSIEECRKALPAARRAFDSASLPAKPDRVACEKLEVR